MTQCSSDCRNPLIPILTKEIHFLLDMIDAFWSLMLGKIEGRRRRRHQRMRWLDGITNAMKAWTNFRTTPRTAAYQILPPMGFSRQEYWSGIG